MQWNISPPSRGIKYLLQHGRASSQTQTTSYDLVPRSWNVCWGRGPPGLLCTLGSRCTGREEPGHGRESPGSSLGPGGPQCPPE